jgi:D-3-phosphoglycerate dehydrogenase
MGLKLGMKVIGFDPSLSVDAAWRLSNQVQRIENLPTLLSRSDYVTLHLPFLETTQHFINPDNIRFFKPGARLLNFSRGEIVECLTIVAALESGKIARYATDFPCPELMGKNNVMLLPHIGASTVEAEDACAVMAATQLIDFLENGNIVNAVNFPTLILERTGRYRMTISNKNIPKMLGKMMSIFADCDINVNEMLNKSRADIAYNLIDLDSPPTSELLSRLESIEGVINVRSI